MSTTTERRYTDRSGHTITRGRAIEVAVNCILRQGDARPIVQEHVEFLTDDELMEWLVYPDTGDFPDEALATTPVSDDTEGAG